MAARTLHCFTEGRDGDWEAICLDLDIAVQGLSFEGIRFAAGGDLTLFPDRRRLPADQRPGLLDRPVPLPVRLMFLTRVVRGLFSGGDDTQRRQFTMPVAA